MLARTVMNLISALVCASIVAGCGKSLGEYRLDAADIVSLSALPTDANHEISFPYRESSKFIRITFSSDSDLEQLIRGYGLYIDADFCPQKETFLIRTLGPFYSGQSRYSSRGDASQPPLYRHPPRDPATGRFIYTAYMFSGRPMPGERATQVIAPYDLRTAHRDVCVKLESPGGYMLPQTSMGFVVPGSAIDAAFDKASG